MTGPQEPAPSANDGGQWTDYGVNVGRTVIGDIHIHPVFPATGPPLFRSSPTHAIPILRHAAFRAALIAFGNACEHAAAALPSTGPSGPERSDDVPN